VQELQALDVGAHRGATRDRARLLSQTENISLLKHGPLEIVRVGRANLSEEAWWRYGRQLLDRRRSYKRLSAVASVGVGAAIVGGMGAGLGWLGAWLLWENAPQGVTNAARWLRFGSTAWRGQRQCANCGYRFRSVAYDSRHSLVIHRGGDGGALSLHQRCPSCRAVVDGGLTLEGREAEHTLRRVLTYHHFSGASEQRVKSATRLIQEAGSPTALTRIVVADGRRFGDLRRTGAIALEIAANDATEQRLLELELAEIEAHWRREEELADIIDGELTPLPMVETLRRKVNDLL
jgi:hypothetical protein